MHLNDDDLLLHHYGELDQTAEAGAARHLAACPDCQARHAALGRVLALIDAAPWAPPGEDFERRVWARLAPELPARRRGWAAWFSIPPARLAAAAAVLLLLAVAFFAGRASHGGGAVPTVSAGDLRERILLIDLSEHLDRSQTLLVELVSADAADALDVAVERERAEDLVAANRLYRQTAAATGEAAIGELLDDLERLLVELAASPGRLSEDDMDTVRSRIDAEGLLFRVRVLSAAVRQRQESRILARTDQSS